MTDATERESMEFDVVIVGGGPAGLAAACRLMQLDSALSIVVVEKGSEIGAHILSGNVFEPTALEELFPNWKELGAPISEPFSTTTMDKSLSSCISRQAAASPAGPPPTMTTSNSMDSRSVASVMIFVP